MKKGLKTLISGIVLFVLGSIVVPIAIILPIVMDDSASWQFLVPGTIQVEVEEPGRYYLWHDYQTVYKAKSYSQPDGIPGGLEISITTPDGEELPFTSSGSMSSSTGSSAKRTIGYVEVTQPQNLSISVSGDSEEIVFSFSKSNVARILGMIFGGIGISMLLALTGVGIAIWGIVKMLNDGKPAATRP